jgi:hypothetical protein
MFCGSSLPTAQPLGFDFFRRHATGIRIGCICVAALLRR